MNTYPPILNIASWSIVIGGLISTVSCLVVIVHCLKPPNPIQIEQALHDTYYVLVMTRAHIPIFGLFFILSLAVTYFGFMHTEMGFKRFANISYEEQN